MSGETTDYLGIILAVAGLFFLVVISSICMSCFKCCQKQIVRRASRRAPAPPVNQPQPAPAPAAGSSYGSTVRKPSILVDRAARKAAEGTTQRLRRVSEGLSPQNIRKAFSPNRQRIASEGPPAKVEQVRTQNKHKLVKSKSQESASKPGDYRIYNIESGSTPELKCSPSKDSLKKRGLFFSFDSFSGPEYEISSGEKGYYSSGSQDGSQWMTPEDDNAIFDSFSGDRTKSSSG